MNIQPKMSEWALGAILGSSLLAACQTGIVVGVEDGSGGSLGLGGAGDPAIEASDYSQRPQPASFCWFMENSDNSVGDSILYEVDMTTGEWGARRYMAPHPPGEGITSIALHGRQVIWNTYWAMAAFDLDTGALRDAQFGTETFTSNGEEIISICPDAPATDRCAYDSVDALFDLSPSRAIFVPGYSTIVALAHDALYTSPWEGTSVDAYDQITGTHLRTIELDNVPSTVVNGIAVVGDRLIRMDTGAGSPDGAGVRISVHDIETGANTDNVYLGPETADIWEFDPGGLICGGTFD